MRNLFVVVLLGLIILVGCQSSTVVQEIKGSPDAGVSVTLQKAITLNWAYWLVDGDKTPAYFRRDEVTKIPPGQGNLALVFESSTRSFVEIWGFKGDKPKLQTVEELPRILSCTYRDGSLWVEFSQKPQTLSYLRVRGEDVSPQGLWIGSTFTVVIPKPSSVRIRYWDGWQTDSFSLTVE